MRIATCLTASVFLVVAPWLSAQTAQISFSTTTPLALPSRASFNGMNMDLANSATAYNDAAMQSMAKSMSLGWVRYPGGTSDDSFNWQDGQMDWVSQFNGGNGAPPGDYNTMVTEQSIIGGKQSATPGVSGIQLADFAGFIGTQGTGSSPTHVIGVINTFTDTAADAATLVNTAVNTYGLHVDVWELGNEPVYFTPNNGGCCNWYQNATDYLNQVSAYASAIKAKVPSAKVAVWVDPSGSSTWTTGVANYLKTHTQFWDEIYTHSYPQVQNPPSNDDPMTFEFYNGFLLNNTNALVDGGIEATFTAKYPQTIEWSEYNMNTTGYKDTLYNAVFNAEFAIRLSSDPNVTNVGMHMLVGPQSQQQLAIGADSASNAYVTQCETDYGLHNGTMYDTHALNFGYYMNPAGLAMELINGAINTSTALYSTNVTDSNTVLYSTTYGGATQTMPAIYAQAYAGTKNHVLITNKASASQQVEIFENGAQVTSTMTTKSIGGTDPTANNQTNPNNIQIVTGTVNTGVITVPANSVMNVSW